VRGYLNLSLGDAPIVGWEGLFLPGLSTMSGVNDQQSFDKFLTEIKRFPSGGTELIKEINPCDEPMDLVLSYRPL